MSELDTLVPAGIELSVAGESITLKPLKVGQMPAFLRVISPVMKHLSAGEINWLELFGERGDDLLSAIAIAVGKPRAWVDELAADEAMLLAAKVPLTVLKERLGHKDVAYLIDTYAHVLENQQQEATAALSQLLGTDTAAD